MTKEKRTNIKTKEIEIKKKASVIDGRLFLLYEKTLLD